MVIAHNLLEFLEVAMKKTTSIFALVLCVALILCAAGCGADTPPETSEPDAPPAVSDTSAPEAPETPSAPSDDVPAAVDLDALAADILAALPQEYQGSRWLNASCEEEFEGGIYVIMQVDQGSDDTDAALALAAECFVIAKDTVEANGAALDSIGVTIVNDGAALGIYSTENGKDFNVVADGKLTEVSFP